MKTNGLKVLIAISVFITSGFVFADPSDRPGQGMMELKGDVQGVLPLKETEVTAEISGFVSRVKVTQVFDNPHSKPIEAVYTFPLPQNAAINGMQIIIGDRIIRGVIKEKEEARKTYNKAKRQGKTAALLDQERPNIFNQSVANIMPGSEIRVEITYDEVLEYADGSYTFVFPMVVGPRYIPGAPIGHSGDGMAPDTDRVPDASKITPRVLKPGERNGHNVRLSVRLDAGTPISKLECPTHEIDIDVQPPETGIFDKPIQVRLAQHERIPNKDFVLRYQVAGEKPETGLLTHYDAELGGFFLLMFQPPKTAKAETVTPKEMVFVVDCSGSMNGEPIGMAKKAMRYALKNLNPEDRFQVIRFSESASPFAKHPLENTPKNVRQGLSYVNGLNGTGGTRMLESIKAALDFPREEDHLRIVSFMTDGYIGNENDILSAINKKMDSNTRLFSFGVGSSVNRYLLERMAEVGRGEVQYMLLDENPEDQVEAFYDRVRNPVLTHLDVNWNALSVEECYPENLPDLFEGQPIFIIGRYEKPGDTEIKINAKVNGKPVTYAMQVSLPEKQDKNASLAPLWARTKIKELELGLLKRRNDPDMVEEITSLALEYELMSQYTSFVAVEDKIANPSGDIAKVAVPVETPQGVTHKTAVGNYNSASNAVPEPGSTILMLMGLWIIRCVVRKQRMRS